MKWRLLFLERNAITNLGSMLKSRNITLPTKVHIVKVMVFPVVCMDVRAGPYRRLNTEELMLSNCGTGKDLRVPGTAGRSNQSILNKINPDYSLEGLMPRLKLQYFGHLMWRADSLVKTQMLGKIEGRRRRDDRGWDGWMAPLSQWTWVEQSPGVVKDREAWHAIVHWVSNSRTWPSDWTRTTQYSSLTCFPKYMLTLSIFRLRLTLD